MLSLYFPNLIGVIPCSQVHILSIGCHLVLNFMTPIEVLSPTMSSFACIVFPRVFFFVYLHGPAQGKLDP
jgi:hypothetical protein